MRIHEGEFAVEVEPFRDPLTAILRGYRWRVFRVLPKEEALAEGVADTSDKAFSAGMNQIAKLRTRRPSAAKKAA